MTSAICQENWFPFNHPGVCCDRSTVTQRLAAENCAPQLVQESTQLRLRSFRLFSRLFSRLRLLRRAGGLSSALFAAAVRDDPESSAAPRRGLRLRSGRSRPESRADSRLSRSCTYEMRGVDQDVFLTASRHLVWGSGTW